MAKSIATVFAKRKHSVPTPCDEFVIPTAKVGVEVEVEGVPQNIWTTFRHPLWKVKQDNSLRNGAEFVTDGGLIGDALAKALSYICTHCESSKYSTGLPRAGIHLHVDMTDLNTNHDREFLNFVGTYLMCEHILFGFAGNWRGATGYCDPLTVSRGDYDSIRRWLTEWASLNEKDILKFWEGAESGDGRYMSKYQAINFLPLMTLGTIEFRHLPTTFDYQRIKLWVNLVLSIKKFAIESPQYINVESMFSRLGTRGFYQRVFGDLYQEIEKYVDNGQAWAGLDAFQYLVYAGNIELFFNPVVNELFIEKMSKLKDEGTPTSSVIEEVSEPEADFDPEEDDI